MLGRAEALDFRPDTAGAVGGCGVTAEELLEPARVARCCSRSSSKKVAMAAVS